MGGRDHSCEICGNGGMNDPEGRCTCDPRAVLVAETLIRCEGFEPHPGDVENWIDHAEAVVKALDAHGASHRERVKTLEAALAEVISRANMVLEDPNDLGDLGNLRAAVWAAGRLLPEFPDEWEDPGKTLNEKQYRPPTEESEER